jgi:hypothetical protein
MTNIVVQMAIWVVLKGWEYGGAKYGNFGEKKRRKGKHLLRHISAPFFTPKLPDVMVEVW